MIARRISFAFLSTTEFRRLLARRCGGLTLACFCSAVLAPKATLVAAAETRAILIGVDQYRHVPQLKGAEADARDIESSLRKRGVNDIKSMIGGAADRISILRALESMLARAQADDMIFLSIAGHGAQEPERIKGSRADGADAVFLLPKFDAHDRRGSAEKILDTEFNHYIKAFEDKGARVFFVADACSGSGLAREVDPRDARVTYRSVLYTPIPDDLQPVSTRADAMLSPTDFKRSIFLAAADKQSKAAEIKVPGTGYRGALSYAVARALEGAADLNGDGLIIADELLAYVRQFTYQLTDERQNIVASRPQEVNPANDVVTRLDRGVSVQPVSAAPTPNDADATPSETSGGLTITPLPPKSMAIAPGQIPVPAILSTAPPPKPKEPIRLALRGVAVERGTAAGARTPFVIVGLDASPDVVWDAATRDVIAGGDVLAHDIGDKQLDSIVDRAATVRWLKMFAGKGPQPIRVFPNDTVHRKGENVEIAVGGVAGRNLVLFSLAGDGTLQFLYPLGSDPAVIENLEYRVTLVGREPLGADQIVAITSTRRMPLLEQSLKQMDRLRNPAKVIDILSQYVAGDARVGTVGIFTAQ
jgi:hypothetical protein